MNRADKLRLSLDKFIERRRLSLEDLKGKVIVSACHRGDQIMFVTLENKYLCIEAYSADEGDSVYFDFSNLSVEGAHAWGIITDAQYDPLRKAEAEAERWERDSRKRAEAEETDKELRRVIQTCGSDKVQAILDEMRRPVVPVSTADYVCPLCGENDLCRCYPLEMRA